MEQSQMQVGWYMESAMLLKNTSYSLESAPPLEHVLKGEAFWQVWVSDQRKGALLPSQKHMSGNTNVKYVMLTEKEMFSARLLGE